MSIDRRSVLKGMAACGLAGPLLGGALPALAGLAAASGAAGTQATLVLVAQGAQGSAFVQGARAGRGAGVSVQEASLELAFLLGFGRLLQSGRAGRVIGLLDDAVAAPLLELARGAGARLPWLGQHRPDAGPGRHRLLATAATADSASRLAVQLAACGAGWMIEHIDGTPATGAAPGTVSSAHHPAQWAASLGYLLASPDPSSPDLAPPPAADLAPLAGSFVSFLIET